MSGGASFPRRIYLLDVPGMTEEEVAVVLAMTSRRPEPFDEIAQRVTAQKAAEFHEKWVLGYGHASVAEHAVLHFAVENISRLACDHLEDARLASFTEKSSRFQVLPEDFFLVPPEVEGEPRLGDAFVEGCRALFRAYHHCLARLQGYLASVEPRREGEKEGAYALRLRRRALDACRALLPCATLTSVGVTINARSLEHTLTKLLSSDLEEVRAIGRELKERGRGVAPTLVKYADESPFLRATRKAGEEAVGPWQGHRWEEGVQVRLLSWDEKAEEKVIAAYLYRFSHLPYEEVLAGVSALAREERERLLREAWGRMGPFDAPGREAEVAPYILEMVLDYGAYRELKRHRMMTVLPQPLTVDHGYLVPDLVQEGGLEGDYRSALAYAEGAYEEVRARNPLAAQYLVTHAHRRRVLVHLSLRQCYHLFKLRTGPQAHPTLRAVMEAALRLCREVHPSLFAFLQPRDR